uniref:Tetratricopeptide TPR_2 repeat protein n=1 Tax=Geobacter sp. (strain M21) TaxID=443144 RepID=C6E1E7_GEOSM
MHRRRNNTVKGELMALKSSIANIMRGEGLLLLIACQLLAAAAFTPEASAGAFDQLRSMTGGGSGYIPAPSNPECVSGCGDSGSNGDGDSGYRGPSLFDRINEWQEQRAQEKQQEAQKLQQKLRQEQQQQKQEAFSLNEQGNRAFERNDWSKAVDLYRSAVSKSPNDKIIQENLRRAEREKQRVEELRKEQSAYRKRMGQLVAVLPASKPLSKPLQAQRAVVPHPGFTPQQWQEYLAVQETVAVLYARLNKDGVLSDADSAAFYSALRRRNELWAAATDEPRSDEDRDRLRLALPRVVNKALLNSVMGMFQQEGGADAQAAPANASSDRRLPSAASPKPPQKDAISTALAADFFADKITKIVESETGEAIEEARGETFKNRYERLLSLGRIAVKAQEGVASAAGAETADLLISKMPEPMAVRAEFAVEGGRMYSKVAYQALNRFMTDAMNATGASFDAEAFWKRFNDELSESRKGVKAWIQFGE